MRVTLLAVLAVFAVFAFAEGAFAYPNALADYPDGLERSECIDCHSAGEQDILEPGSDPVLLAAIRKGPHGGYTTGTSKCQTCHSLHNAPAGGTQLLAATTIKDTCESCHDGTGGVGVYGAVLAQTGEEPVAAHRIEATSTIPGGDPGGGSLTSSFSGPGGTLTCNDCHAPHDTGTVEPFTGDRLRATVASDTAYAVKTNRLLRQVPTGAETTVTVYGAGWCGSCHKGRLSQHGDESGAVQDHPVMQDDEYYYDRLPVVTGVGSITTTMGPLGQSSRGYVMPGPTLSEPTQKTPLQEGRAPICQQCHEDARDVGPTVRKTNPTLAANQEFQVSEYGGEAADNPPLQVFPHESATPNFLVREPEPTEPHALCLSCHSLLHTATPGSDWVLIFAPGQHDSALPGFPTEPYVVWAACSVCHTTDLLAAHADQCETCHSSPYDTLPTWNGGCQQGGCHTTYHDGSPDAHDPYSDTQGGQCGRCHTAGIGTPNDTKCANCHSLYNAGDTTPPVTTSDAVASYVGAARIAYTITESGKAGIGITFSRLDGGDPVPGSEFVVTEPGPHTLEFWSVDQLGNVESPPKTANFTITADTTPPVTTSNAQASYMGVPANITLTATDASTYGVKTTYYSLDGGPTKTGTFLSVPAVSGVVAHTLNFWSEDWSGNVETTKTANFTITGGTATMRFYSGNLPDDRYWVEWLVWRGPRDATPDYSVYQEGPYNGSDDLVLPLSATGYYVVVSWGSPTEPYDEQNYGYYYLTTPGQVFDIY